ncbi:MAG: BON domain-containing protein [Nitrospira sp.]|nr:BON domain-containing protein [Nitrospira sp.]
MVLIALSITARILASLVMVSISAVFVIAQATSASLPKDSDIAAAIDRSLQRDAVVSQEHIHVSVKDGIVTLGGGVPNLIAKDRTVQHAESMKGVRAVVNRLQIQAERRSDEEISNKIQEMLGLDPATRSLRVNVSAREGQVTFSGSVPSWAEKELATEAAKSVKGVSSIRNLLTIEPQEHREDEEIKADIERRFQTDVWLMGRAIDVHVNHGVVHLEGTVRSALEKSRATTLAYVLGITRVHTDRLTVEWSAGTRVQRASYPDPTDDEIARAVKDAFSQDPRLRSFTPRVEVRTGTVNLSGSVGNLVAKRAAEDDARHTVGVRTVNNRLEVRPSVNARDEDIADRVRQRLKIHPTVDPGDITVIAQNGIVSLDGAVDNLNQQRMAEDLAGRVGGVVAVTNRLQVKGTRPMRMDEELKTSIEDQLWWSPFVDEALVQVEVRQGVATLTGTVDTAWEKRVAEENAREGGASIVRNHLQVASDRK